MKKNGILSKFFLLLVLFSTVLVATGCKKGDPKEYWTDERLLDLSVRDYVGKNGVVAAANPYAAKAGLDVLKLGGNAFDAAVAVSFALGVVEPNASGVGGGGILVAYEASTGEYISYNFREFVPEAGTATRYGNALDLDTGALSTGVPTQVAGLVQIQEDHGNITRQEVMAPAIDYAKNGVIVTPELGSTISNNFDAVMACYDETADAFTTDGISPISTGELLVQTNYAKTLQAISDGGAEAFYTGEIAQAIVDAMNVVHKNDVTNAEREHLQGIITLNDLQYALDHYPIKETPVIGTYNGYDIASATTPSSGGIILLETLNMLEIYARENGPLANLGHNTSEYLNVIGTAMQLAYGDKRQYIADSRKVDVPIAGLISKAYAAERWQKYTPGKAYLGRNQGDLDYGDPWKYMPVAQPAEAKVGDDYQEHYSTTTFSVADKEGNIVSVTQTINHFFGNHIVPEGTGFFLNNQLSSFSLTPSSAAYVEPFKQPVSHIMPTIVMKDGNPYATLGSPGSMRIPAAVVQVLLNMIDFGMNIQEAINSPRIYSYAVASNDNSNTKKDFYVEKGIPENIRTELDAMGYNVIVTGNDNVDLYFGGVQGIRFIFEEGKLHGGADPRRDGKAVGY